MSDATAVELEVDKQLEAADDAFVEARFADALALLDDLLQRTSEKRTRARILTQMSMTFFALGNVAEADRVFADALALDWNVEIPKMSSRIIRDHLAQRRQETPFIPRLSHLPPGAIQRGHGVTLRFLGPELPDGFELVLGFRASASGAFSELRLFRKDSVFEAELQPAYFSLSVPGSSLEYFVSIESANQAKRPVLASPSEPLRLPIAFEPKVTPVYSRWWFWTAIVAGAGVVAGGTAAAVLLSRPSSTRGDLEVIVR